MPIPESQLETWSHLGSITQSSTTYNTIKHVLEAADTPYEGKNYSVFLQGSYRNNTNVYAESDVDIVIKLDDCWQRDLTELPQDQKDAYENIFVDAKYTHTDFKRDVLKVLTDEYGSDVKAGNKSIKIADHGNRRKVDVIVAIQFRRYHKFKNILDQSYDEGICFYNAAGERISNYPKQHSENLTKKHQNTSNRFKPMVRILKNLRWMLVADGHITAGIAPSYYLECLFYNVANEKFTSSFQKCFVNAFNWIQKEADKTRLVCANGQHYLLRDGCHTCWSRANGDAFINAAIKLWNNW